MHLQRTDVVLLPPVTPIPPIPDFRLANEDNGSPGAPTTGPGGNPPDDPIPDSWPEYTEFKGNFELLKEYYENALYWIEIVRIRRSN